MAEPKNPSDLRDGVAGLLAQLTEHAVKNAGAAIEAAPALAALADAYARLDDVSRRTAPKGKP